jgi:PAS domain S-box-containing protein
MKRMAAPEKPSAELFQIMAQRVRDYAIFLLDVEGRVMSWNTGAQLIKQYLPEEIIGRHFSTFYTPEDIQRKWPDHELKVAQREGRFEDEGWRVRKDGSRFWAGVTLTALRDEAGRLVAFSKITRDMTQRKLEQERLRESEERFRLLVEGVQDYAVYMLSPEGVVTSWNAGARRIKGYDAAEVIGGHVSRFYLEEDVEASKPWSELAIAREHGRTEDEGWRVRKDGSTFWARVVVSALHSPDGRLTGFAKVTQDLSQRRHSEALEDTARRINDFIAVLAHELRNPLAPIRNAAEVLKSLKPGDAGQEAMVQAIDRQSAQLARLVDDLLDISRITRGALSIQAESVDVADIVSRAVEAVRPLVESEKHTLKVSAPSGALVVHGDRVRLTQALTNVLGNAARYTDPGGQIVLRVEVGAGQAGRETVRIQVQDTGRGIEPALLGSVFGMFVQGRDPVSRAGSGLGIGLALARSIVELHHGTLVGESPGAGKGSTFTLELPLVAAKAPAQEAQRRAQPAADAASSRRVLVVDDNVDAAAILSIMLRQHGHEVHVVHDGVSALHATEGFRPHIILLDIGMPGMSGYEVARRLRERAHSPHPLIVAVTGWGTPDERERAAEAGFDLHLVKPVEEDQILQILGERPATRH